MEYQQVRIEWSQFLTGGFKLIMGDIVGPSAGDTTNGNPVDLSSYFGTTVLSLFVSPAVTAAGTAYALVSIKEAMPNTDTSDNRLFYSLVDADGSDGVAVLASGNLSTYTSKFVAIGY